MTLRRMMGVALVVLGLSGLTTFLSGCGEGMGGGSKQETNPNGEVKINVPPGSTPASEEYKNMGPGGKTK
jgi:hypothetical protein